jgi:integrase
MGEQRGNKSATSARELEDRIRDANKNLEKVSIRIKRDRLFVRRRNFPPKPGDNEGQRYEIGLGVSATVSGLKVAIAKAKEIDNALVWDKFDWQPYLKGPQKPPETVEEWVQRFEKQHWSETPRTPTKENSYHKDYRLVFNRLPQQEVLTFELLKETILQETEPGKRSRKGFAMAFRRLGLLAGLDAKQLEELSKLGRGYSPKSVEPRELPTDEDILDVWESLRHPGWQWVMSVLAIYGLRPHEVFRIRTDRMNEDPPILEVEAETKTGWRLAYPSYSATLSIMQSTEVIYPNIEIEDKNNNQLGDKISQEFRERKIPFPPYNLRHAYAQRMYKQGFSDNFIARSMGHSVAMQRSVYRAWWDQDTYDEEYRRVMQKKDEE